MTNLNTPTQTAGFGFNQIGWRYYKEIKKKAMEQEFSWSGLLVSLSIAFFIVVTTAFMLNLAHKTIKNASVTNYTNVYQLEIFSDQNYLNIELIKRARNISYKLI